MRKVHVFEESLSIDPMALDECLIEQPALFYHVADGYAKAVAERDMIKLALANVCAELDQQLREEAEKHEEKITEKLIEQRLRLLPEVRELNGKLLAAQAEMDRWLAMKEAFQQRSYVLRELVALKLGELHALSIERGAGSSRVALRDGQAEHAQTLRRQGRS
jgi:hypothetical protein